MRGVNLIVVFNKETDKVLMCKRRKDPYQGLYNFVGGKIEENENGFSAAYRELYEETGITENEIRLYHLMDFTYHLQDFYMEVYVGKLNCHVEVSGEENELCWKYVNENFGDATLFAGMGNIAHIINILNNYRKKCRGGECENG